LWAMACTLLNIDPETFYVKMYDLMCSEGSTADQGVELIRAAAPFPVSDKEALSMIGLFLTLTEKMYNELDDAGKFNSRVPPTDNNLPFSNN